MFITKIKNESGDIIKARRGIANVFREFYKKLYDDNEQDEYGNESNIDVHISDTEEMTPDSKKEMQVGDVKIEILTRSESVRYPGQPITSQHQETTEIRNRIRTAWATSHKYRQELISKNYLLKHRVGLFDAEIIPTICCAWAPTKEHERMLQSAQRKMLRLIMQTKRRYKKIAKHTVKNSEDINDIDSSGTNDESEDGKSDTSHNDQDSDVSFEIDNDEEIDAEEIEEEELVEYIKRSTIEAMEKMENEKIRCWK